MPAKFQFPLQPLLDWRKRVEEEKQRDFAACRRAVDESARELDRLAAARWQCARQLAASARRRPAADLRLRDAHLRSLDVAIDDERRRRCDHEAALGRARAELITASRERRVIERLKERQWRLFEAEEARREELELDESNARNRERTLRKRLARRRAESAAP
jgi:flagellar protein FliJ